MGVKASEVFDFLFIGWLLIAFFDHTLFITCFNVFAFNSGSIITTIIFLMIMMSAVEDTRAPIGFPVMLWVGLLHWYRIINLWWAFHNPGMTVIYVIAYLLIGAIWSVPKLWMFLRREDVQHTLNRYNSSDSSEMVDYVFKKYYGSIYSWIVYWPFDILYSLCYDVLDWILVKITNVLKRIYVRIIVNAFEEANKKK